MLLKENYYFVASSLPDLQIDQPAELSFSDLNHLLSINLLKNDYDQVKTLRRYYDIENIRSFYLEEKLSDYGNFNELELEEALLNGGVFPEYVHDFLDRYSDIKDRLKHFPGLLAAYFRKECPEDEGFLRKYLSFEREMRLVTAGMRAKDLGRDISIEFQFEDPYDEVVGQILAQRDAKTLEPPQRYEALKSLYEDKKDEPLALHQALCEYRMREIASFSESDFFSIDRIMTYLVQLILVETWMDLDKKKGMKIVDTIVKEV